MKNLRGCLSFFTYTVDSMRFAKDGGQAQIPNLDLPLVPIDENVVAFEISVDDGRVMAVEIEEAHQDLPAPMLHYSDMHSPVHLPVAK